MGIITPLEKQDSLVSYTFLFPPNSDSPYSEHGTLEEVDQDAGTEPHTSEDGKSRAKSQAGATTVPCFCFVLFPGFFYLVSCVSAPCSSFLVSYLRTGYICFKNALSVPRLFFPCARLKAAKFIHLSVVFFSPLVNFKKPC